MLSKKLREPQLDRREHVHQEADRVALDLLVGLHRVGDDPADQVGREVHQGEQQLEHRPQDDADEREQPRDRLAELVADPGEHADRIDQRVDRHDRVPDRR